MKNIFTLNLSAPGLMTLLICAASLTGCSDEDKLADEVQPENNMSVLRATVSTDELVTRAAASNELGSWGYSEETGIKYYPFAWPDVAYSYNPVNCYCVFAGLLYKNGDYFTQSSDFAGGMTNYTRLVGNDDLVVYYKYFATKSDPGKYSHLLMGFGCPMSSSENLLTYHLYPEFTQTGKN